MFNRILCGVAASAILFAAGVVHAQDISPQRLSDHIKVLADDSFEGRFPGKVGEELTLNYLQSQYEALGLEPGGVDGSWRQPVELLRLTPAQPPVANYVVEGVAHDLATSASFRAGAGDGRVTIADAPVVFAGFGIVAPERNWDDYGDADLTGKVVVLLDGQPDVFGEDPNFYGSGRHKTDEALKRGAAGVVTVYASPRRALGRATRPRMTIVGASEPRFTGSISTEAMTQLAAAKGQDFAALQSAAEAQAVRPLDLGVTLNLDIAETPEVIHSNNLLAKITGSERPDEYVVYSAHWDHVGVAADPGPDGDRIFNGAWDNASGTSGLIEVARAFKEGSAPKRTVVFLHVTAEEQGLLGSEWYGAHPVYPLERTAADINIDMLPFTPETRTLALFGFGKSSLEDDLNVLAQTQGRTVVGDGEPEQGFYYRSDHFNFAAVGVPAIMPWTAVDFVEGGEAVGKPYYQGQMAAYYHGLKDEWRADYDFTAAVQNLQLLYRLGLQVADSTDWPQWKPGAEFEAIRAASDAARR